MAASTERFDLDGKPIKPITICMIGAGGFIGSHLCEKVLQETPHKILALDVYNDKIKHLLEPDSPSGQLPWPDRIQFHRLNIKNDSRLEGLIKMSDLVGPPIPFVLPQIFCSINRSALFFKKKIFTSSVCRFSTVAFFPFF